ncbi:Protein HEG-like 1 [Stylophora pistillata]|uniref:Protein HEG-like 1 n=1 Tax=Stylophora pistillata TaxID=50429 RepID=A0A2B4R5S0_STYPI|nr:Protein HEG-like 1 [Stylophora pistillata]
MEDRCKSINMGTSGEKDKVLCELSESDHLQHPNDLKPMAGFMYRGTENKCCFNMCYNNATCLVGFTDKGYKCVCPPGYTGDHCEKGDDLIAKRKAWDDWLEEIGMEFRHFKITEPLDKKNALIIYGTKELVRLEKSWQNPTDGGNEYEKLKKKPNDCFMQKKNKHHVRYVFLKMTPSHDETTNSYAARLREKTNNCVFEANCDEQVLEDLIQTTQNRSLIQKALNKKWDLTLF